MGKDTIYRQDAIDAIRNIRAIRGASDDSILLIDKAEAQTELMLLPSAEPKKGKWILSRSGAYCCSKCMEPCASYVMMRPRDRFCKMCGADMRGEENT